MEERFWAMVTKPADDGDGCWLWTGRPTGPMGYGRIMEPGTRGRGWPAHRYSYFLHSGVHIPPDLQVCHKCDVRLCVRPDHLFLGTAFDNMGDAAQKGRIPRGETQHLAKLTEQDVIEIRRRSAGGATYVELGADYGVTPPAIGYIVRRETWKHVN